jgi:predicted HTH domain antitoxin
MSKFIVEILSVPNRENLVAEIWHNETLVAEINQEKEQLEIELYQSERITFELEDFILDYLIHLWAGRLLVQ